MFTPCFHELEAGLPVRCVGANLWFQGCIGPSLQLPTEQLPTIETALKDLENLEIIYIRDFKGVSKTGAPSYDHFTHWSGQQ